MAEAGAPAAGPLLSGRVQAALLLAFAGQILLAALKLAHVGLDPGAPLHFIDFEVFHAAGRLALEGRLDIAYDPERFWAHTRALSGSADRMQWPYPPHFNLVAAALALLPLVPSYTLFMLGSLAFYTLMLRRVAAGQQALVLMLLFPAIIICLKIGQNDFLIGGLAAWLVAELLAGRPAGRAGVALGLLSFKPQFAAGLGLYLLQRRHWRSIALGALVALALLAAATLWLGSDVWPQFLHSGAEVSRLFSAGLYKYHRMYSLYAALFAATGNAGLALAGQIGFDALLLAALLWCRRWPPRQHLAAAAMVTALFSPYAYDYDLPILGVAIALLAPAIAARGRRQLLWLVPLAWLACLTGVFVEAWWPQRPLPSLMLLPLLALCAALLWLGRAPAPQPA